MEFKEFQQAVVKHFNEMVEEEKSLLFIVDVDSDYLYESYINSYPTKLNTIYRKRRKYDCSSCKQFIRQFGNVVTIRDNKVISIWDFVIDDPVCQHVIDTLSEIIHQYKIKNLYFSNNRRVGVMNNLERTDTGIIIEYNHFYVDLPERFIIPKEYSINELTSQYNTSCQLFYNTLEKISIENIQTVLDLIEENILYRGDTWKNKLKLLLNYKNQFDSIPNDDEKLLYIWENIVQIYSSSISHIKNTSIGVLLLSLSDGNNLDSAVKQYESIVAPENYKRSKPIFTQRMLDDAQKTITDLGYLDSLPRRFATLDDITINDILFANRDASKRVKGASTIFEELSKDTIVSPKNFDFAEVIGIEEFIKTILPNTSEVSAYLDNQLIPNFVSLIAPMNANSKSMFKWNNGFGWAYRGNITDRSSIKENVKKYGGGVNGVLRFSLQWNENGDDNSDLDAHCYEPEYYIGESHHIYFNSCRYPSISSCGGTLDVDIRRPIVECRNTNGVAVENITYLSKDKMIAGKYTFFVNQYENRGNNNNGFKCEIEFDGNIYSFEFNHALSTGQSVLVADVFLDLSGKFTIKPHLPSSVLSKNIWNLSTKTMIPVSVICYSPNYWNDNNIGNKHYFFMLKDCLNDEKPNGIFNEYLNNSLYEHRKVMEALGSKVHVEDCADQLSGLGFSSTIRNELDVQVKGSNINKLLKIKF